MRKQLIGLIFVSLSLVLNFISVAQAGMATCTEEEAKKNKEWCSSIADFYRRAAERRAEQQPESQKDIFRRLLVELVGLSMEDLYLLKAGDPCGYPEILQCRGVQSANLKPFVENALDLQKETMARRESQISRVISVGGVAISLSSLLISVLSFRRKKEDDGPIRISKSYGNSTLNS